MPGFRRFLSSIPDGSLAVGSPARVVRALTPEEIEKNRRNALAYLELVQKELKTEVVTG